MLAFHGELAFLLRTFFFVLARHAGRLCRACAENIRMALLCFAAIFVARWIAVQTGRLAWRGFSALERELMIWFVPRGLITAVLGIEVVEARGATFEFLPSLAFAVILLTNLTSVDRSCAGARSSTHRARGVLKRCTVPKLYFRTLDRKLMTSIDSRSNSGSKLRCRFLPTVNPPGC